MEKGFIIAGPPVRFSAGWAALRGIRARRNALKGTGRSGAGCGGAGPQIVDDVADETAIEGENWNYLHHAALGGLPCSQ